MRAFEMNALLSRHGETGSVLRALRRCSLLGWLLFMGVSLGLIFVVAVVAVVPRSVLVVDGAGRVVGQIDWHPTRPTRAQAIDAAKRFVSEILSMNSATVFDEYAHALNQMAPSLRQRLMADLKKTNYLGRVEGAHLISWVEFDQGVVSVRKVSGATLVITLTGKVVVDTPSGQRLKPFHMAVTVQRVARTPANSAGVEVSDVTEAP